MVVSKQPRLVPGSFTHVPALPPAPAAAGGDDDEPSERHSPRFQLPGPRAAPADRAPGPAAAAAPAHPRAPPRATLYLQDDEPSTSPLEWLGVGGAAGPFGWTASDGTVAREPSAAAAAPPEPLDLSEALAFEQPQDSEGAKRETWLRPDGEGEASPCLEHVRKLRELSQRSAANERSLQTLMGAVQEAGVRMRRSEHEVARLSERAQDATTQQLLAHAQALLNQRSMEFQKKRQQHVALVHRLREDNRALEKIQQKIAKVRKGSGHAAVFSSSSSAKSLGNPMAVPREDSTRAVSPLPVSGEAAGSMLLWRPHRAKWRVCNRVNRESEGKSSLGAQPAGASSRQTSVQCTCCFTCEFFSKLLSREVVALPWAVVALWCCVALALFYACTRSVTGAETAHKSQIRLKAAFGGIMPRPSFHSPTTVASLLVLERAS
jgi:hypothetical protein